MIPVVVKMMTRRCCLGLMSVEIIKQSLEQKSRKDHVAQCPEVFIHSPDNFPIDNMTTTFLGSWQGCAKQ